MLVYGSDANSPTPGMKAPESYKQITWSQNL